MIRSIFGFIKAVPVLFVLYGDIFIYRLWFRRWGHRIEQDEVLRHTLIGWLMQHEIRTEKPTYTIH